MSFSFLGLIVVGVIVVILVLTLGGKGSAQDDRSDEYFPLSDAGDGEDDDHFNGGASEADHGADSDDD